MASRSININLGPLGLLSVLIFIVFLTLKLGGWGMVAGWSWLWVTSPLWLGFVLIVGLFILFFIFAMLVGLAKAIFS